MTKVAPALPGLREELGLTLVESGFIATMFNLMGMLVGMLAGVLCDRFGHQRLAADGPRDLCGGGLLGALAGELRQPARRALPRRRGLHPIHVSGVALMNAAAATPRDRAKALGLWSSYMPSGRRDRAVRGAVADRRLGLARLMDRPFAPGAGRRRALWRAVPASQHGQVSSMRLVAESLAARATSRWRRCSLFMSRSGPPSWCGFRPSSSTSTGLSAAAAALATALYVLINAPGN